MNKIFSLILLFVFYLNDGKATELNLVSEHALSGKILDSKTGKPLIGVTLYFPDQKIGTTTDTDGKYYISRLPQSTVLVHLNYLGFRSIIESVDLSTITNKNFEMEYAATELNEVVITGLTKAAEQKRTPTPIAIVSKLDLLQNASSNIIDAIASQPGISQITTGSGISKPVIRGLGYNRVVVVNDGVRQEGQQWGDEHGIEIDENDVGRVEILKGPASLVYGSDAMAGVVNMLAAPTLAEGKREGSVIANYQTNNGLMGISFNLGANKHGFVWDIRYSNKQAHSFQNQYDGYVFNSGFRENAAKAMFGLNKSWGFSNVTLSNYHLQPGIVEGERDEVTGQFTKQVANAAHEEVTEIAIDQDSKSYHPSTPFQQINHYKAVWNSNVFVGKGNITSAFGFQQNRRQEFADVLHPADYQLYFLLNTTTYDVRYNLPESNQFNLSFGVNGMQQSSRNKGVEFLVPEYNLFDVGVFSIAKMNFGALDLSGGLRLDNRSQQANDLYLNANGEKVESSQPNAEQRFVAFNASFTGVSGSLGATWQISKSVFTKLNLSRGFRAPSIGELGANGVHEGTIRYELGDANLKAESSLQLDYTIGLNSEHISAELNLFDNSINNYIFLRKLNNALGGDSIMENRNVFKYVSGDAHLFGGELRFDIHPHPYDWLHIENSFSYVNATQRNQSDTTHYLPLTPAPKWQIMVKADIKKCGSTIRNGYVKVEMENYFTQNKFYSAFGTETKTPGYSLLNAGFGTDFVRKSKTICSLFVSANNLTDVAYQSHLSRLKYAAVNLATGRSGVYNMGRNISVKLVFPLDF